MATLDQARKAKASLKASLGKPGWLRGLGIGSDPSGGAVVRVNVATLTDEVRQAVPTSMNGVSVEIHVVGDAEAQSVRRAT